MNEWWKDKQFVEESDSRLKIWKPGKIKGLPRSNWMHQSKSYG